MTLIFPTNTLAQCPFVVRIIPTRRSQQLAQRIIIGRSESKMRMPAPAFGVFEAAGHSAHRAAHAFHFGQIRIHALADVEPFFLSLVLREHLAFLRQYWCDVNILSAANEPAQTVA